MSCIMKGDFTALALKRSAWHHPLQVWATPSKGQPNQTYLYPAAKSPPISVTESMMCGEFIVQGETWHSGADGIKASR